MKTLEYSNDETKKIYKLLITSHPAVSSVINRLESTYGKITVTNIINDNYYTQISACSKFGLIEIKIDALKKRITLNDEKKSYDIIFDDLPRKQIVPIGYEYQNEEMVIFKKNSINLDSDEKKCTLFEIHSKNNDIEFTMIISNNKISFDENDFINHLLKYKDINNIKDLYIAVTKYLNINIYDIKITDSKGSIVIAENGELIKYIEYRENGDIYYKIYLENDEFYVEKIVKEKCNDESLHLIKKIGESNGKEKKRS